MLASLKNSSKLRRQPVHDPGCFVQGRAKDRCRLEASEEPARTAEAARRALPELARLNRYERRAAARRDDRAIRTLNVKDTTCS
jgi:hypothetical protein